MHTYFITANDTEVGKTYVTGMLARYFSGQGKSVQIVKAIECGGSGDAEWARAFADSDQVTAYTLLQYPEPLAPLAEDNISRGAPTLAAMLNRLAGLPKADVRLIEGAGGVAVPIDPSGLDWLDLIDAVLPDRVIAVVDNRLGSINQSRLLHNYLGDRPHAFILNEVSPVDAAVNASNLNALNSHALPLLGIIKFTAKTIEFLDLDMLGSLKISPEKKSDAHNLRIEKLEQRKKNATFRELKIRQHNETTLNLSDNDTLGLRNHPALIKAAQSATAKWGTSSSASPLISGYTGVHAELEKKLSDWYGGRPALVWNSGYAANQTVLKLFIDRGDLIIADRLIHNSLINGILQTGARLIRFRHNDLDHLEALLEKHQSERRIHLVTESVYSMDGDYPDLGKISQLKSKYPFNWFLDEAHALGWYGQSGSGLAEVFNVLEHVDVLIGTLGKALASSGAFTIFKEEWLRDYCINEAGEFIYSTYLPPTSAASAIAALELAQQHPEWRTTAQEKARSFRKTLLTNGWHVLGTESAIVPVLCGASEAALELGNIFLKNGIRVGAIRPPTVPKGQARLRISLKSNLTDHDYETLYSCFDQSRTNHG
ncbi:MAG: 8-amino-7-oxononanoate synthase [Lentimonas sp.]|jgi:8-amino-7-oxononanoate synthase